MKNKRLSMISPKSPNMTNDSMRLLFIQVVIFLILFPLSAQSPQEMLKEAHANYQQGERENSYHERNLAFNRALSLYQTLNQQYPQSANLDQALGDTYFQLNEYPWAILYYQRALKEKFNDPLLLSRLKNAQEKIGISIDRNSANNHFLLSLSQNMLPLFTAILITFLAFTSIIWFPSPWMKKWVAASTILLCLLIGNSLFFYYFSPLEAIVVKTTGFYRAPDWNQSQLTNDPLLAGSKVQILQMTEDGNWLKIERNGLIGYVPIENLRSI